MSSALLSRLYFLGCELKPSLPSTRLMRLLGKTWSDVIIAGSVHGLAGTAGAIGEVSFAQVAAIFEQGAESGSTPDIIEFRSGLAGLIYDKLCANPDVSSLEKLKLSGELSKWFSSGNVSSVDSDVMDWDTEVSTPMFTKTGLWFLDKIAGGEGLPQDVISILSRPEAGKSTIAIALAYQWRRLDIGPVSLIQTEMSPAAMALKIKAQAKPGEKIWRSGIDKLIYGNAAQAELDRCIEESDPDRLIIFDSTTGHCGSGDTPDGRNRYVNLYTDLMRAKNHSRTVVSLGHVKRGEEIFNIESAAGSSFVDKMSGLIICLDKDDSELPNGMSDIKIETVKNRWSPKQRAFTFTYDYVSGLALPEGEYSI